MFGDEDDTSLSESEALVAPEEIVHVGVMATSSGSPQQRRYQDNLHGQSTVFVDAEPLSVPDCNRRCVQTLAGGAHGIYTIAVLTDGHIVSGSCGGQICIWDAEHGNCIRKLTYGTWIFSSVALADGGYACGGYENGLQLFGQNAICGSSSSIFSFFGASSSSPRLKIDCLVSSVACMCELTNGNLVTNSGDHDLAIWESTTGKRIRLLQGHSYAIRCLAALYDGSVVSGSEDKNLKVWNIRTGACVATLTGHRSYVLCVTQAPEKFTGFLISGSADRCIKVWDPTSNYECIRTLTGHTAEVSGVCVCGINGLIVSSSHDCTVRVWDSGTGACVDVLSGHTEPVYCVAVLNDGHTVVSGSKDKTLRVWN
jgi:WD40 repeat protein